MSDKEKSLYPNPKDYKEVEALTLAYTFARGATELLKTTIEDMKQRESVVLSLKEKEKGERKLWGRI